MICAHYDAMLGFYGVDLGGRVARKHLGWYMDQAVTPTDLRRRVLTEQDPAEVLCLIADIIALPAKVAA
ncbi:MAG: tRNA dihydrouridine synthase DusB, partial [Rhodobacterales bacterium]